MMIHVIQIPKQCSQSNTVGGGGGGGGGGGSLESTFSGY